MSSLIQQEQSVAKIQFHYVSNVFMWAIALRGEYESFILFLKQYIINKLISVFQISNGLQVGSTHATDHIDKSRSFSSSAHMHINLAVDGSNVFESWLYVWV